MSSPSCDRDYAVRGCVERGGGGGLSGSRLHLLKAHMHASISFNSLLRVPGIRVCLRCGIRQEVNFLDDIPQGGRTVVLQSLRGARRPNGIYNFLDDKQSYCMQARSKSLNIVFDRLCHVVDRICGLVVRVPAYRSRGPGSITGASRYSEK
jgi:hypothetical protein